MSEKVRSIQELIDDPRWEDFSSNDIVHLVQIIQDSRPGNPNNLSAAIFLLGKVATQEYRELIEKFLYYPKMPWISAEALKVLCRDWGLTKEYLREVKLFIKG